ncbi:TadE/TadG family type IV pilus assembly protein [Roseiarcus sp.]|uniref:TadE/TadG family type IV pilus assembly protein n=1 Tax=Roseiarcus sp. TaxID=1969460 RepID=UPI003F95954B
MTRRLVSAWAGDKRGAAAVEAALILPVAVGMLGLIAIWAQGLTIQRKVTLAARTITDLVSQQGSLTGGSAGAVNQSTVDALLNNAANVLYPVVNPTSGTNPVTGTNVANMTMVVSEIKVDPSGATATVQWSEPMPSHGTALPTTAGSVQLPNSVAPAGSYLIMGTVTYAYTPPVIGESVGPYTLQDTIYLAIRQWTSLSLNVGK